MLQSSRELDPGIEEAVATVLWVTPRLSSDVPELKEAKCFFVAIDYVSFGNLVANNICVTQVSQQLAMKYSKEFAEMCRKNGLQNVNEKVIMFVYMLSDCS